MLGKNHYKVKSAEEKERIAAERMTEKLQERYRKRPYSIRWAPVEPICNIASWTLTGYSFFINSFAIAFGIYIHYQSTLSIIVGLVLGLVLGTCIEAIKRLCNYNFWHGGISEGDWSKGNAGGMVISTLASVALAFWGGLNLPELTTSAPIAAAPLLEDISSIERNYDFQIETLNKQITDFDKSAPRWKGMLNRENSKQLGDLNKQLTELMQSKNTAVSDAQYRNRQKEVDAADGHKAETLLYNEYKAETGWLFAIIAVIVELLMPLPFWAKERYFFNSALELINGEPVVVPVIPIQPQVQPNIPVNQPINPIITNPNDPTQAPPTNPSPTTPITKKPIGFVFGDQPENEIVKNASNPLYNEFEPVFTPPVTPEKEPEKEVQEPPKHTIEKIVLKNTYTHTKSGSGGTVEMSLPLVQSRVRQYQTKVDEAIANIEELSRVGDDINLKMWKGFYHERNKQLLYWQDAEQLLKQQIQLIKETVGE